MSASAAVRGVVVVGRPYYGGFYRPFWGAYWGPYWGPSYGYTYALDSGEVKLDTKVKDAQVFINGACAGTTLENKSMHLRPGNYTLRFMKPAGPSLPSGSMLSPFPPFSHYYAHFSK